MSQRFNSHSVATRLGAQVRASRLRRGLSLCALGNAVGVHHSQISRLERGQVATLSPNVQKICKYLSVEAPPVYAAKASVDLAGRVETLRRAVPEAGRVLEALLVVLEEMEWPIEGGLRKTVKGSSGG